MINKAQQTSFGSTYIPYNNTHTAYKYISEMGKYFNVKWIKNDLKLKPQQIADSIELNEAVFRLEKEGFTVIGKDGGAGGADTFLGRILKRIDKNARFTDDIKPLADKGEAITLDLSI